MPEYQYKCTKCNAVFSIVKPMLITVDTICPNCKTDKNVKRIYSPIGIIYKAEGFYKNSDKKPLTSGE